MISPKYSTTHYSLGIKALSTAKSAPHVVNLFFDYNCPFSAKLYLKLYNKVIPELQKTHPDKFQFVYINVVQPWHTNSTLLNEFGLAYAKVLREKNIDDSQKLFWDFNKVVYQDKEQFYDNSTIELTRNQIYEKIYDVVAKDLDLKVGKDDLLKELLIKSGGEPDNAGNGATADVKYFTRIVRNTGIHVTPTVTVDGVVDDSISSGTSEDELIKVFTAKL
ncbi:hypothetical protein PVL30_003962 [Lodderomyces elongisporus]|uniref:Thioredoxin-like fold domain-containing protein n=1 Tax=Lodderomyces elongisporus (strain ATCC 11503 / CBS 2605 / JCM 1781 / NBRC 1676 / NRRL YB-4239) TaxID=379508 RepID=A5E3P7_LODEL|nr:uncharacterized protein PVL30_003962 [Lodderomyces elongisporus]EDK46055.1 conserved hypothetical protein [Lodderomyces elongisporus NRRL YB-4239]WLF80186.1 hypothetical protein PVL30_003962 [Lodderomyces elongisporus]